MKLNFKTVVRGSTVKLIGRILTPWSEEGVITLGELNTILLNLKHLANKGSMLPEIMPRLLKQEQAAEMLGISLASFKRCEKLNVFPFKRRKVGSSVRYRNIDVINYLMLDDEAFEKIDTSKMANS